MAKTWYIHTGDVFDTETQMLISTYFDRAD